MKNIVLYFFTTCVAVVLLFALVKGQKGDPIYFQYEKDTRVGGPFEASNSTSRYALTESIVEYGRMTFDRDQARFAAPDMVRYQGRIFTLFTPGVSFVGIPFYIAGEFFSMPQIGTYLTVTLFALGNMFLVALIARRLGASSIQSLISGFTFLFATNALSYALSFTQHHLSTTMILLSLLLCLGKRSFLKNIAMGLVFGIGLLFDIPNVFMMFPPVLYAFFKSFQVFEQKDKLKLAIKLQIVGLLLGVLPLLGVFAWYNNSLTGSPTKIAQLIGRIDFEDIDKPETAKVLKSVYDTKLPFDTRSQLNGFYTLLVSDERSWIYYSPVILIGILGFVSLYRRKEHMAVATIALSVLLTNILIYSMFGDPWGGWAFGARYLIPGAAILAIFMGPALRFYQRNPFFIILFFVLFSYSIWVSMVGALTTSNIPPKVEAVALITPIPYTYQYNLGLVAANRSSSLLYSLFFDSQISLATYLYSLVGTATFFVFVLYTFSFLEKKGKEK